MSFPWRCLSITKNSPIYAIKCFIDNLTSYFLINLILRCLAWEYTIKCKIMMFLWIFLFDAYIFFITEGYACFIINLFFVEWSNSYKNSYISIIFIIRLLSHGMNTHFWKILIIIIFQIYNILWKLYYTTKFKYGMFLKMCKERVLWVWENICSKWEIYYYY